MKQERDNDAFKILSLSLLLGNVLRYVCIVDSSKIHLFWTVSIETSFGSVLAQSLEYTQR